MKTDVVEPIVMKIRRRNVLFWSKYPFYYIFFRGIRKYMG